MELINELVDGYASQMSQIDRCIRRIIEKAEGSAREVLLDLHHRGGKRLRPLLVLLASDLYDYSGPSVIPVAAAVELIHLAALLHDDVLDEATTRRGGPTFNHLWGDKAAVLAGDFLWAESLQLLAGCGEPQLVSIMSQAVSVMCRGEIDQLNHRGDFRPEMPLYLQRIEDKTAYFIAACCRCGPLLAGRDTAPMGDYGLAVGMAYQIIDDLLDVVGQARNMGKGVAQDLSLGTVTAPLIFLLQEPLYQREAWGAIQGEDKERLREMLKASGALEKTWQLAHSYAQRALAQKERLPDHPLREVLGRLALGVIERTY
ncbi:MAG: polyprenyl synthetase family protein [Limnochordia bacterium]|jgi:heptaprenyl diphosphate synthase